jgi:choline monooxygenase
MSKNFLSKPIIPASQLIADNDFIKLKEDVPMQPYFYTEDKILQDENLYIFSHCWNFVGLTEQVAEHGQFITAEIAGTSVVIQNFKGKLSALHNVCTHRFAILQKEKCGKRALTCPYHGWTYDVNGVPFITGNAKYFQLNDEARQTRSLRRFSLKTCGRFIFVRLSNDGPSLKEFLGNYVDVLEHLSAVFINPVDSQISPWNANWKLGVESVLEVYHVDHIHPESFKNFVQPQWNIEIRSDYNNGKAYLTQNSAKWWDGVRKRLLLKASDQFPNYDHLFIFPNLAIGLTQGCLMSVQTYTPMSSQTSELHYRIFLAESSLPSDKQLAVRKAVNENIIAFNREILSEDQRIMEQVQMGHRQMTVPPILGINEARISKFHMNWHHWMANANCLATHKT